MSCILLCLKKTCLALSAAFFCWQAARSACVGAVVKCSQTSPSYTLHVPARVHACIKNQWQTVAAATQRRA